MGFHVISSENRIGEKLPPPSKNRVWDFFAAFASCVGFSSPQPVATHQETFDTTTIFVSGALYYGFRYYAPGLGRWVNRDPIGEKSGCNVYVVLANSALTRFDLLGLLDVTVSVIYSDIAGRDVEITDKTKAEDIKLQYDSTDADEWGHVSTDLDTVDYIKPSKSCKVKIRESIHIHKKWEDYSLKPIPPSNSFMSYTPHFWKKWQKASLTAWTQEDGLTLPRNDLIHPIAIAHERGHATIDIKYIEKLKTAIKTRLAPLVNPSESTVNTQVVLAQSEWDSKNMDDSGKEADAQTDSAIRALSIPGAEWHPGAVDGRSGTVEWMWY